MPKPCTSKTMANSIPSNTTNFITNANTYPTSPLDYSHSTTQLDIKHKNQKNSKITPAFNRRLCLTSVQLSVLLLTQWLSRRRAYC